MRAFFAILRRELSDATLSPFGQRLMVTHLAMASLALLLGWPISYTLGGARAAPTLAWWVYVEMLVMSYLALAIPSDIFPIENKIRTGDWVVYGEASVWAIHFGKACATLLALAFWLITVLPIALIALAISPTTPDQLRSLGLFSLLLFATLVQFGTWIGVTMDSKALRVVLVDVAFAVLMLGSILAQSLSGVFHVPIFAQPLEVAARIMNLTADVPWTTLIVIYASLFISSGVLSLLSLRQWRGKPGRGEHFDSR